LIDILGDELIEEIDAVKVGSRGPKWTNGSTLTKLKEKLEKARDVAFIKRFDGCCDESGEFMVGSGDLKSCDRGGVGRIRSLVGRRCSVGGVWCYRLSVGGRCRRGSRGSWWCGRVDV